MGAAFKDESFYTQAISTDAAVVNFNDPADCQAGLRYVSRCDAGGAHPGRRPGCRGRSVRFGAGERQGLYRLWLDQAQGADPGLLAIKADYNKKAEKAADDLQSNRIDRKAYDKLGNLRQQGEDAYKRCFAQRAPQQPSFADATRQAEALLAAAIGK